MKDFWKLEDFKSTKYNYITYQVFLSCTTQALTGTSFSGPSLSQNGPRSVVEEVVFGTLKTHDMEQCREMLQTTSCFHENDILINDRGFLSRDMAAFRKKPFIHIPLIVPEVPPQFGQQFRLRHCERNIRKAGLSFELGGNGKAQQDVFLP